MLVVSVNSNYICQQNRFVILQITIQNADTEHGKFYVRFLKHLIIHHKYVDRKGSAAMLT